MARKPNKPNTSKANKVEDNKATDLPSRDDNQKKAALAVNNMIANDIAAIMSVGKERAEASARGETVAVDFALHVRELIDIDPTAKHVTDMRSYLDQTMTDRKTKTGLLDARLSQLAPAAAAILSVESKLRSELDKRAILTAKEALRRAYAVALWSYDTGAALSKTAQGMIAVTRGDKVERLGSNAANKAAMAHYRPDTGGGKEGAGSGNADENKRPVITTLQDAAMVADMLTTYIAANRDIRERLLATEVADPFQTLMANLIDLNNTQVKLRNEAAATKNKRKVA